MASHELDILVRAKGALTAARDLGKVDSSIGKIGQNAKRGFSTATAALTGFGIVAAGAAATGLVASVKAASDLNENISKNQVIFGKNAKAVLAFSKTTASALGLSQAAALDATGAFGNMFKTVGLADKASGKMSIRLVKLAADMASFNNEDPSEMLDKLRSGLSGEAEPLRKFGILLSEAAVAEEAYAKGITKRGKKLTEAQKVQARYSLIIKQTAVQQGDFERTSGGVANQMRILRATFTNIAATIGTAVLPQVAKLATRFNKLVQSHLPDIEKFAAKLPGLFDRAIEFGDKIPWATIKDTFVFMGKGAKEALRMFTSLPPWVQTAVLTGWGLNKLTGGAVSGIVGELGKGLIKGVLGMTAGVVNINAGVVKGGGVGGVAAGGGASKTGSRLPGIAAAVPILGIGVAVGDAVVDALGGPLSAIEATTGRVVGQVGGVKILLGQSQAAASRQHSALMSTLVPETRSTLNQEKQQRMHIETTRETNRRTAAVALAAQRAGERVGGRVTAAAGIAAKGGYAAAAAIRAKRLSVTVQNRVAISVRDMLSKTTFQQNAAIYG